ncbi:hypothetical protein D6789_02625 [Candidatus Woesearchaeota archaeon]|nr:MAG: hypothetical protein D6789_02625 [Candidatus Woesearchaeota archaeon]
MYYYWDGRVFMFASELKGLLAAGIKRRIDRDAVSLYMSLGFIPAPHSIIEGVWKLEAGQNLLFSLRQKTIRTTRFYIPPTYEPQPTKNLVPRGRELLEKAVHYRSIADVDVGTFLSGGLDSSIVTALLQRQANRPIHSFSIGFELAAFDESRYARLMAEHLGTKHHHAYFTEKDYARIRKRIPDIYDEPLADTSIYPTVKVAELAARHVKACLTGEGGDELFGGYALHRAVAKMDLLFRMPVGVRKMGAHLTRRLSKQHRLRRGFALSLQPHQDLLANIFCRLPADRIAHAWYKKHFAALLKKNGTLTESVIRFDLFHHTVPDKLNVKVDRAGMASSLEIRCPFLDKELLSFSAQIPTKHKLSRAGSKTKVLLRSIAKPWLPREILQRKKQGFSAPAFAWVQNEPETIVHAQKELRGLLRNQQRKQLHAITQKITARQKLTRYEEDRLFRATLLQQWRERWEG